MNIYLVFAARLLKKFLDPYRHLVGAADIDHDAMALLGTRPIVAITGWD